MAVLKLSYKLSDFKRDPIMFMELSSHKREVLSPSLILEENNSNKKWIGKIDRKNNRFAVSRYISRRFGFKVSCVEVNGVRNQEANEFKISLNPSIPFVINYIVVPLFVFFVLYQLSLGLFSYLIPVGIFVLNTIVFNYELNKTEGQIESFVEHLTRNTAS